MPLHQIPKGFLPTMLAVAAQFTTLVEHPQLLPAMSPSILPPNSCYHPAYHQFLSTLVEHPTVVTTHITIWFTSQQTLPAEHDKWRVGNVEPLQAQEESPFIGQLDPGKHQLAIETGMYRAPGFAYTTPPTDFLLIRNATGAMSLRELTGCFAVGQQVPAMRAPVPGSRDVR